MNSQTAEIFTNYDSKPEKTETIIEVNNLKIGFGQQQVLNRF
jgi:hypothetical protein